MKIVSLKYDFCIKEVMENEIVRKHFISDVLCISLKDIKSVQIINPFLWQRYQKQKLGILDIQLELNDNTKINIEMQLKPQAYWEKRTVFYLAKMFTADLRRGEAYKKAKKCIAITILDFNLDERTAYHNKYMLRDDDGKVYTDILELHTIELKKKPDKEQPTPLDEWHSLFNAKTEEDLDMIKSRTKNKGIMEAIKELKEINLIESLRYGHELRLKVRRDREAEDEYVFEQGKEAGRQEGMQGLINILRRNNYSEEEIITELMAEYKLNREDAENKLK